ncbi:EAL domain-containing protein [Vibrio europaeus]|uniref:EAL domain-containing protein n=1 Tax=Vibrio europaeus TaxID=300876 RepID=A0ABT5GQ11_9VIBR|nr:EAL domain-containing protein [Vibrio europaeus]MDC5724141.1 EAL domain-containing protein [Vibrio europaeus]MDC5729162.1 EAL domain-containing protein [Vibrio europaeus]MDC5734077.1 EAL domain-containing protein [Vibrio europaeus]MDC5739358.1 EAL domain-containing protein [Vibrio europaeus]MDC5744553.1 EAL domain-containing protein [Vibrio europaeus]
MFYSFNLCDDNSLDLVLSGSQLYSIENDNKKRETDLDERERFVLEFLINNSSVDNPISLKDLDSAYRNIENKEIEKEPWQTTIRRLQSKFKRLTTDYGQNINEKRLISTICQKGYYVGLTRSTRTKPRDTEFKLSDFKPSLFSMLGSFLITYKMALLRQSARVLLYVGVITSFLYSLHIYQLTSIVEQFQSNIDNVAQELTSLGCHDDETHGVFNHSLYLDSALLISPFDSCFVDRDSVDQISEDYVNSLLNLPQFTYSVRDDEETYTTMIGRVSLRAVESMYSNNLWSLLVDGLVVQHKDDKAVALGESSGIRIHAKVLDGGTTVSFYASNLLSEIVSLFLLVSLALYWRKIARFIRFCQDWVLLDYALEPVVDTTKNNTIYHEILTRVTERTALQYIENLAENQLITFHTVLIAKTIVNAQRKGLSGVYGINICPGSLLGSHYLVLENYLSRLQPSEVVLELTENSNLPYDKEIYANISKLQQQGFKIALDDFGTGNNNVEIVQKISLDYLKIDKEFIRDIDSNEAKQRLLGTLSEIGEMSECEIIQEGVETYAQQLTLQSLGYNLHQGYLYV